MEEMNSLNSYRDFAYKINKDNGFWDDELSVTEKITDEEYKKIVELAFITKKLALIASEACEGIEALREGSYADYTTYKAAMAASTTPEERQWAYKNYLKDTLEGEIVDIFVRALDLSGFLGLDIDYHLKETLMHLKSRGFKHGKKF